MEFNVVQNLKSDVDANLHSGGVSSLANFANTLERGRLRFVSKVRPEELVRKSFLEDALFPETFRYAAPVDLKYQDIQWIKKLSDYRSVDTLEQPGELIYDRRFTQKRNGAGNQVSVGYENGIKYVKVQNPRGLRDCQKVFIHNCDSLNDNGSWNVAGNVVNFKLDELNHVQGRASYSFDINNSSNEGFIANYTLTAFDLFDFLNNGAVFGWMDIPIPQNLTSVQLRMGSDTTDITNNYYYATVNQAHDNNTFTTGWNLLKWMGKNLINVGTPNPRALTWIEIRFTTNTQEIPNCHFDQLIARRGAVYECKYNSTYILIDPQTRAWKKRTSSNADIIVAEEDSYLCLMLEVTLDAQKEIYGNGIGAKADVAAVEAELEKAYKKFKMEHKSEAMLQMDSIHIFGNMYDDYSDDPMPGFGNEFGQRGSRDGNTNNHHSGDGNQ